MPDRELRPLWWAVLVVQALGQVSAATAGVLPWLVVPLALALFAGGSLAALSASPQHARLLRGGASVVALVAVVVALPTVVSAGEGGPRSVLGPLLVVVQALHAVTWRGVRDLRVGLLGGAALLVLGGSFAPDLVVGLPLLLGWLVALVAVALAAAARPGVPRVAAATRLPVAGPAVAAVLGLVAFLLVPIGDDAGLRQRLARTGGLLSTGDSRAALGPAVYSSGRVDLRRRGALSEKPVARISADSPRLWRGAVYDRYDGSVWSASPRPGRSVPGPPYQVPASGPVRTDRAELLVPVLGLVWAPGRITSLVPRRTSGDSFFTLDDAGSARFVAFGSTSYEVSSTPPDDATGDDPRWRQLPRSLPPRVHDLAASLAAGRDPAGVVAAVEQELQRRAVYTTDSPAPGPGEDAVDRFLFLDRAGYCEQFAASAVVLLRSAGVAARMVTGLSGGVPSGGGMRLVREKDLHAWVEAWVPGQGWVTSDPTPPGGVADVQGTGASVRARVSRALTVAAARAEAVPGGRPALAACLVVLSVLVALTGRLLRRRRRLATARPVPLVAPSGRPALAAFLRWDARLGPHGRRPAESLAELRRRLSLSGDTAQALQVVEQECYAPVPPGAASETAARVLDRDPAPERAPVA